MIRALRTALANWIMPRPLPSERLYTGAVGEVVKLNAKFANRAVDPPMITLDDWLRQPVRGWTDGGRFKQFGPTIGNKTLT